MCKSPRKLSDTERIKHKPSLSPVFPNSADITTIHTNPEVKILRVTLHSSFFLLLHPYQIQIQCRYLTNLMRSLQLYHHCHDLNSHDVSLRPLEQPSIFIHFCLSLFHQGISVVGADRITTFPKVHILILGTCESIILYSKGTLLI